MRSALLVVLAGASASLGLLWCGARPFEAAALAQPASLAAVAALPNRAREPPHAARAAAAASGGSSGASRPSHGAADGANASAPTAAPPRPLLAARAGRAAAGNGSRAAHKAPAASAADAAFFAAMLAQADATSGAYADPHAPAGAPPRAPGSIGGFPFFMLLGTSKGGSTFLFKCLQEAFHPRVVCGADEAAAWTAERCGSRRFLLSGLRLSLRLDKRPGGASLPAGPLALRLNTIKENYVLTNGMYRGPRVEPERTRFFRGPALPLELWEARNARGTHSEPGRVRRWLRAALAACARSIGDDEACPLRDFRGLDRPHAWRGLASAREGEACGFLRAPPPADAAQADASVGGLCARRGPGYANRLFSEVRAFAPPLPEGAPPARPWESRLLSADGCPYNFGSGRAPSILSGMLARGPAVGAMRFVVLLREPVDRAYSEWAMTNRWGSGMHMGGRFSTHARRQAAQLDACMRGRLRALVRGEVDDSEFGELYARCVDADYYAYVSNSLYGLHLRSWLRFFDPGSFLLLQTERMARTPPAELLRVIADFAGLHLDPAAALETGPFAREARSACSPQPSSSRAPNLKANGSLGTPVDEGTRAWLRAFFFQGQTPWMHMVPPPQLRGANGSAAVRLAPPERAG